MSQDIAVQYCIECGAKLNDNDSYGTEWVFYWCVKETCPRRYLLTWPKELL